MFSGIIYNQGILVNIKKLKETCYIELKTNMKLNHSDIGSSINANGVCLTLVKKSKDKISFYLSKETLRRSNFKHLKINSRVNFEKSLLFGKNISGHYVQGHIDTIGTVTKISVIDKSWDIYFKISNNYKYHLIEKASIAINGVSLTIARVKSNIFMISIIPHTLKLTNLINLKVGNIVNIEFDIFSKYLLNLKK
tara:strand:+ start:318 stop:902 length:585 start_codon:yes stop_codon:yes gene_type:complete